MQHLFNILFIYNPTYLRTRLVFFKCRHISSATMHVTKWKIDSYINKKIVLEQLDGQAEPTKCHDLEPRRVEEESDHVAL